MDELLDKFLKDEVTPEQFEEGFNKLADEDKSKILANPELTKKIAGANAQALEALRGVRTATKKIKEDAKPDFAANLRKENVAKASQRFFQKFSIPPAEQQSYLDGLDISNGETVSEDLLYSGLSRIYASTHSDELLKKQEELDEMKANGEQFNANNAGPAGTGGSNPDGKVRDPKVLEWMREASQKGRPFDSYEAAERALSGTKRIIG